MENNVVFRCTVPLDPRTKKNHQIIAGIGRRCPACGKPQKQYIRQGKSYEEYERNAVALLTLARKPSRPIDYPVNIRYTFYLAQDRLVDNLNLAAAMDDILVTAGVLADDNRKIVAGHDGTRSCVDRKRPRTEIVITRREQ